MSRSDDSGVSGTEKPARRLAPAIIFGCILAIAIGTVATVAIGQCTGDSDGMWESVPAREIAPGIFEPAE